MKAFRAAALLAAAFCPGAVGAFEVLGPVWGNDRAPIFVGALDGAQFRSAIADAARDWEAVSDFDFQVSFDDEPACDRNPFGVGPLDDGAEFALDDCNGDLLGDDTLAVTLLESQQGEFVAVAMIFNDALDWTLSDGPWDPFEPDFRRVALHELGHWLGLDHAFSAAAIMQPFASNVATLQADDIAGVRFLYGPTGPPPPVGPVLPPEVVCQRAQLRAAGALCRGHLACRATAVGRPAQDPQGDRLAACVAKAGARFDVRFDAAVAAGGCLYTGPAGAAAETVATAAGALADGIVLGVDLGNEVDAKLRKKLLTRVGATCSKGFAAEARFAKTDSEARRARERANASESFLTAAGRAIARAAAKAVAYDGTAPADAAAALDAGVDAFADTADGD